MSERELSQKDLAELANMDPVQLNRILKGKKGAGPKSLKAIAEALKIPVDDLIHSSKPEKPTQTVSSLLQALSSMQKESVELTDKVNQWLKSPLYQIYQKADEGLRRELDDLVEGYVQAEGKEKLGALQLLSPKYGEQLLNTDNHSPDLAAKQPRSRKGRQLHLKTFGAAWPHIWFAQG